MHKYSYDVYTDVSMHVLNLSLSLILAEKNCLESILHSWHLALKPAFHIKQLELEVIKHRDMARIHLALISDEVGLPFRR